MQPLKHFCPILFEKCDLICYPIGLIKLSLQWQYMYITIDKLSHTQLVLKINNYLTQEDQSTI